MFLLKSLMILILIHVRMAPFYLDRMAPVDYHSIFHILDVPNSCYTIQIIFSAKSSFTRNKKFVPGGGG